MYERSNPFLLLLCEKLHFGLRAFDNFDMVEKSSHRTLTRRSTLDTYLQVGLGWRENVIFETS